ARVGDVNGDVGSAQWRIGWVWKKMWHDGDDFGKKFNALGQEIWISCACAQSDASAKSQNQRALRRWVKQKRNVRVAQLGNRRGRAAHLETIVHEERAIAIGRFSHGHSRHAALADFTQRTCRRNGYQEERSRRGSKN